MNWKAARNDIREIIWSQPDGRRLEDKIVDYLKESEWTIVSERKFWFYAGVFAFFWLLTITLLIKLPKLPWPV